MNCRHFEEVIVDLVHENGLEESVRSQALAHAESCARCSGRLQSERALSAAFKLAGAEGGEAPAHVETALLEAYRGRQAKAPLEVTSQSCARSNPRIYYWGIAAALVVALLGAATYRMLQFAHPSQVPVPAAGVAVPDTSQAVRLQSSPEPAVTENQTAPVAARSVTAVKKPAPLKPAAKTPPADAEIATDFFQLASGTEIASMESGQLVRVLLPRNAMASFGLPVNQERLDEPVTAQVLIGQDGVARAIRFLSSQNTNFVQTGMRSKR